MHNSVATASTSSKVGKMDLTRVCHEYRSCDSCIASPRAIAVKSLLLDAIGWMDYRQVDRLSLTLVSSAPLEYSRHPQFPRSSLRTIDTATPGTSHSRIVSSIKQPSDNGNVMVEGHIALSSAKADHAVCGCSFRHMSIGFFARVSCDVSDPRSVWYSDISSPITVGRLRCR